MITITAFKWVPPFAQGQVRDHRLRWILREVGWPYTVRLLDAMDQRAPDYLACQPFGQVPILTEDGRPAMFETGAILLDIAERSGRLLPTDGATRGPVLSWHFAALNSVEPFLMALAEIEFFLKDEALKDARRPAARKMAEKRMGQVQTALGARDWLATPDFSLGDLTMASVLKIAGSLGLMEGFPALAAWQARCFERPAYQAAIAEQLADFEGHGPEDMRWPQAQ